MIHWLLPGAEPQFPSPCLAQSDGLVAVGGEVSAPWLLSAYRQGIFPWYGDGDPILWWSPDPRFVLTPKAFHLPRSLGKVLRRGDYEITADRAFADVIEECAAPRGPNREATWITPAMRAGYVELHQLGYAHSIEAWHNGQLAGGLYGVALGACFFGESMFARRSDASKAALATLAAQLKVWEFTLLDCQLPTDNLRRFGARGMRRRVFLQRLRDALDKDTRRGAWVLTVGNGAAVARILAENNRL